MARKVRSIESSQQTMYQRWDSWQAKDGWEEDLSESCTSLPYDMLDFMYFQQLIKNKNYFEFKGLAVLEFLSFFF